MSDGRVNFKEKITVSGARGSYVVDIDGKQQEASLSATKAAANDWIKSWKAEEAKSRLSVGAESYVLEKAAEMLASIDLDGYVSPAMMWGKEYEAEAIQFFADRTGINPYMTGDSQELILSACGNYGVTPDGLIGMHSGLEVKCPQYNTHIKYLLMRVLDDFKELCADYYWQVQGCLLVTGREEWEFISYNPTFKDDEHKMKRLVIPRVEHDIARLEKKVQLAIEMRDGVLNSLKTNKLK
ncbi:YqaJ viral recombinase family protein [Thiothrix sp.]|uniref:YqaJ viral recombinase family protein n=1 Tax=Thiothrix sp. TaxID=1032 RepID=UPI0026070521|nr:YqaJ viral recombinase family protein [Thiothrix sp.]